MCGSRPAVLLEYPIHVLAADHLLAGEPERGNVGHEGGADQEDEEGARRREKRTGGGAQEEKEPGLTFVLG